MQLANIFNKMPQRYFDKPLDLVPIHTQLNKYLLVCKSSFPELEILKYHYMHENNGGLPDVKHFAFQSLDSLSFFSNT